MALIQIQILIWIHIVLLLMQPGTLLSMLCLYYSSTMQHLGGSSTLALAAQHGKLSMVKFLLRKEVLLIVDKNCVTDSLDTDKIDQKGTALHLVK